MSPDLAQLHARHRALIVQKRERVNRIMQGKSAQNTGTRHTSEQQNKACKQTIWHALQVTASNWHPHTNGRHVQSTRGASPQKCHHTFTSASTPQGCQMSMQQQCIHSTLITNCPASTEAHQASHKPLVHIQLRFTLSTNAHCQERMCRCDLQQPCRLVQPQCYEIMQQVPKGGHSNTAGNLHTLR